MAVNFSPILGNVGGAVSDLFEAKGHGIAAKGYTRAAQLTEETAKLAEAASRIRTVQVSREAYRVIGGQQSDVAGAGFAASGTALDLLRSSQADAALELGITQIQGAIEARDYKATAEGYKSQAAQEKSAQKGSVIGGIVKGIAAVAGIVGALSDRRLKRDIVRVGVADNGLPIYRYKLRDERSWRLGFMADEVQEKFPDAVIEVGGYLLVDYEKATRNA